MNRTTNRINFSRSVTYLYDQLNRISDAVTDATSGQLCWGQLFGTQSGGTFTSGYDPWGNLNTITADPNRAGCTVSAPEYTINAYNKIVDSGYSYDSAGNMTAAPGQPLTYDAENHLLSVGGANYTYDGDGKRVQKSSGKFYWYGTGSDALDETDTSGDITDEYIFFAGHRIARRNVASGNIFYYFTDHLGTSRVIVQDGQTAACYDADFYPFGGEAVEAMDACSQNYKFTGKERDSESGLDNFGFRYGSAATGRFMTPDPAGMMAADVGNPQTLNRYSYVTNNPLGFTDPFGLDCVYLNDEGTGIEAGGIDHESSPSECSQSQGYWVDGTVTDVTIGGDAETVSLTGTTNGDDQTYATYQQDDTITVGWYLDTILNPAGHNALDYGNGLFWGLFPKSDLQFMKYTLSQKMSGNVGGGLASRGP